MIKAWAIGLALLFVPQLGWARSQGNGQQDPNAQNPGMLIQVVPNAKLIGSTTLTQVREFPEMRNNPQAKSALEGMAGVAAMDNVYQTRHTYKSTVSFFDKESKKEGMQWVARTTTPTSTAWTLKKADGAIVNVIVRNTKPVTFETVEAAGAAGEMNTTPGEPGGANQMHENGTPEPNQNAQPEMNQPGMNEPGHTQPEAKPPGATDQNQTPPPAGQQP